MQSKTVIIYISIIQTGFRRKSKDLFESVSLTCSIAKFVFMQYTNSILDLSVTIGYNIQLMVAYRSTGMELRLLFLFTQVRRDNRIKQRASFCSSFYLYTTIMWKHTNESRSLAQMIDS